MMVRIKKIWSRLFLEERSSLSLSLFRIAVALTVGLHVIPTLCNLEDNYLATAFKTINPNFFTPGVLDWVAKSPDVVVYGMTVFFYVFWFFFLVGFWTQGSSILMTLACYYFYALNAFHVGTLSWDILLVTVFLMCVTPYPGDYFSIDCLRGGDSKPFDRKRPFFIQRLLQLQLASTFFYTGIYKITAKGNWLTDNPLYYLVNYPPEGVTKLFLLKDFLSHSPGLCYGLGVFVVCMELLLPFLLFYKKTRLSAIYTGVVFHICLLLTLDVPAIFFWLFPPMFFLFINPDLFWNWIQKKRARNARAGKALLLYDGKCGVCRSSVCQIKRMDLFGTLEAVDFHSLEHSEQINPLLTKEKLHSEIHLVAPEGEVYAGFFSFRKMAQMLPMLYPLLPVFYFPGSGILGPLVYKFIAKNRYLLHRAKTCRENTCGV